MKTAKHAVSSARNAEIFPLTPRPVILRSRRRSAGSKDLNPKYLATRQERANVAAADRGGCLRINLAIISAKEFITGFDAVQPRQSRLSTSIPPFPCYAARTPRV